MKGILFSFVLLMTVTLSSVAANSNELDLYGQGEVRYLGFIKVYDALLYAPMSAKPSDIQAANSSFCLVLDYRVGLSADQFVEAAETVLSRQQSQNKLLSMRPYIETLHDHYQDVRKGDRYSFCYDLNTAATSLTLNGQHLVTVKGAGFAELYAGIWLGERDPIDSGLREDLLGSMRERRK